MSDIMSFLKQWKTDKFYGLDQVISLHYVEKYRQTIWYFVSKQFFIRMLKIYTRILIQWYNNCVSGMVAQWQSDVWGDLKVHVSHAMKFYGTLGLWHKSRNGDFASRTCHDELQVLGYSKLWNWECIIVITVLVI
jgi:hypothetical protein